MRLKGKVALVTGAGQGVGRGVALALAAEGARVAVVGRTAAKCENVADEIAELGGEAIPVPADVSWRAEVQECVATVRERLGAVECLINAAQTTRYGSLRKLTEDDLEAVWPSASADRC